MRSIFIANRVHWKDIMAELANYTVRVGVVRLASLLASELVFQIYAWHIDNAAKLLFSLQRKHSSNGMDPNCACHVGRYKFIRRVFFPLLSNAYSSASLSMLIWQTYPFFVFNWLFLFGSMKPASKRERCQAIGWMPHSIRPQSIPTYCCRRVASIWADSHRWNTDLWTMLGCANSRWCFRRFAMGDSNSGASLGRDSNRSNRPVRWCRNTSICVEHCPRQPSRPTMSDLLISPVIRAKHPPNRLCTSTQRYPPPIQWWK